MKLNLGQPTILYDDDDDAQLQKHEGLLFLVTTNKAIFFPPAD